MDCVLWRCVDRGSESERKGFFHATLRKLAQSALYAAEVEYHIEGWKGDGWLFLTLMAGRWTNGHVMDAKPSLTSWHKSRTASLKPALPRRRELLSSLVPT